MARFSKGLLGGISGVIGDVEGYMRNGYAYVRARKKKRKLPPTLKQLRQRQKMVVVNKLIDSMTAFVRAGFQTTAKGQTFSANNAAKSYQILHSLQGEYPNFSIDFSKVSLTRGNIEPPKDLYAIAEGNGIRFTWTYDAELNWNEKKARTMIAVYAPDVGKSHYFLTGETLASGTDFMMLPKNMQGKEIHVYVSFANETRNRMSNSCYLGSI